MNEEVTSVVINRPGPAGSSLGAVIVIGRAGAPFNIEGPGNGSSGLLIIAGRAVPTTTWNDRIIKGELPKDLPSEGAVMLQPTDAPVRMGSWPPGSKKTYAALDVTGPLVTVRLADGTLVQGTLVSQLEVARAKATVAPPAPPTPTAPPAPTTPVAGATTPVAGATTPVPGSGKPSA